jgi:hypothetical protein
MSVSSGPIPLWRRLLRLAGVFLLLVLIGIVTRFLWKTRDRYPGYTVDTHLSSAASLADPRPLRAGFGRRDITPDITNPARPVWMAGFSQGRSATNVHDPLFAVAAVVDDGHHRFAVVSIDSIGMFNDDVITLRRSLPADLKLDYVTLCSTHNHSTPDLMGLWGPDVLHSGIDPEYRDRVIRDAAAAIIDGVKALQTVRLAAHEIVTAPAGLVTDTRKPEVYDADLRVLHFVSAADGKTVGSIVGWGNHPETPWSGNRDLTADFPGVIRESLEKGIVYDGQVKVPGLGGIHVFVNGAVGGLMTTHPSVTVRDPFLGTDFKTPSHEKTRALGNSLTARILARIATNTEMATATAPIAIEARTLEVPLANKGFLVAGFLGLLDRGHSSFLKFRTEVAMLRLGDVSIACVPGEVYPEIVNGGVVRTPGGDFEMEPLEVPPVRELMPGRVKFVFGLANDEIGYIIPKSEWDTEAPFNFGAKGAPYGEVNSVGPETARILHTALGDLCRALKTP